MQKTSLWKSIHIESRVIGALLMREIITRYGRHNIGFLWLFVEPMTFTIGVTILWNIMKAGSKSSLSVTAFAISGYASIMLWRNTVNRCNLAITPNLSLMYHRNVKVIDVFASRILLEAMGATTAFIILVLVCSLTGLVSPPADILEMIIGWILLGWFGASLGIITGSLTERSEVIEKIWHPISYMLFPFSGAAYMVEWLPVNAQEVVLLVPIVHAMEIIREGYFGKLVHAKYDVGYIIVVCSVMTLLGLALVRETGRRLEPQ